MYQSPPPPPRKRRNPVLAVIGIIIIAGNLMSFISHPAIGTDPESLGSLMAFILIMLLGLWLLQPRKIG